MSIKYGIKKRDWGILHLAGFLFSKRNTLATKGCKILSEIDFVNVGWSTPSFTNPPLSAYQA